MTNQPFPPVNPAPPEKKKLKKVTSPMARLQVHAQLPLPTGRPCPADLRIPLYVNESFLGLRTS